MRRFFFLEIRNLRMERYTFFLGKTPPSPPQKKTCLSSEAHIGLFVQNFIINVVYFNKSSKLNGSTLQLRSIPLCWIVLGCCVVLCSAPVSGLLACFLSLHLITCLSDDKLLPVLMSAVIWAARLPPLQLLDYGFLCQWLLGPWHLPTAYSLLWPTSGTPPCPAVPATACSVGMCVWDWHCTGWSSVWTNAPWPVCILCLHFAKGELPLNQVVNCINVYYLLS